MANPVILNLGCGSQKFPGVTGVDRYPSSSADVLAELTRSLPFANHSADRIVCSHLLEHVPDLVALMEEIHRVLVPGGTAWIEVPYFAHHDSFRDPTHRRFFTWESFDYFVRGKKPAEYTSVCFDYRSRKLVFSPGLQGLVGRLLFALSPRRYEKYYARSFPARVIQLELVTL